jgi:lipoprotein-anchoring transpeptidase ErfK/SrfK
MRGPFRAEITINAEDPARGEATLFLGSLYAGRFPVSFGDDVPTPGRTYQITERLEGKPFYDPAGPPLPARSPSNPYGLHWLGLNDPAVGIHSLGRHGGEEDRRGSIRLQERDAADVFGILSIGSIVKVLQ